MASGAPDWEKIVTITAQVAMGVGAPDWERIVVGSGGVPIGGSLTYISVAGTGSTINVAPAGSATIVSFGLTAPHTWLVLGQVGLVTPETAGTYGFAAIFETDGLGTVLLGGASTWDQRDFSGVQVMQYYTYPLFAMLYQVPENTSVVHMVIEASSLNPADLVVVAGGTPPNPQPYMLALQVA